MTLHSSVAELKLFVSALTPAPEPAPAIALELPVKTDFTLKSGLFMFFYERVST
jgi:hypothetical protein